MNELIAVSSAQIGEEEVNSVNARDLHAFLENGDNFATWIKDRIAQYDFVAGADFQTFSENSKKGRPRVEYAITLDMAKELSMVERNEKGKRARQYFIDCERRANRDPVEVLNDPESMRGLLLTYSEKVIALEGKLEEVEPVLDAYDRIARSDGSLCVTDAAKDLQLRPKDLFQYLSAHGWIYRRDGNRHWLGYQSKTTQGLLEHKVTTTLLASGEEKINTQVRVTPKGLTRLAELINPAIRAA